MGDTKLYENALFTDITGPAIRPGGFNITKKGIEACGFDRNAKILDLGCGRGASVEFIGSEYGLDCAGIDVSEKLINEGLKRNNELSLICGDVHELPFREGSFDGVLAECSLSLMEDKKRVIGEIKRVLKNNGCLIISDIYIREGSEITADVKTGDACFIHALELSKLDAMLERYGFRTVIFEDHTRELKELMANIILKYGSMERFWKLIFGRAEGCDILCRENRGIKLGYFLKAARLDKAKEEGDDGDE